MLIKPVVRTFATLPTCVEGSINNVMAPRLGRCSTILGHLRGRLTRGSIPSSKAEYSTLPSRWLSDLRSRLGKCIIFGLNSEQTHEAGLILRELAISWKTLLAESEGFVAGRGGAGLENHRVVWGEMVWESRSSVSKH